MTALLIFVAATRWLLAPRHLFYFDSANFALALEHFNPALHQPQPPGYPLFVAFTRCLHVWVARPETVFLIAGLLTGFAALFLLRALAADLFGQTAGLFAAALLASDPAFWFGGLTNEIRIFLALIAAGVGLLAWRAATRPQEPAWLYGAFASLGIAAGFRFELPALLTPLVVWAWFRGSRRAGTLALGVLLTAATALPWLVFTIATVGGPRRYAEVLWQYVNSQFEGSSAVFGAAAPSARHMFAMATVWSLFGAIVWLWAIPFVVRRAAPGRDRLAFLGLALLPPFLFSAFIHIGDPDQALASVTILCAIGGGVLAALRPAWTGRQLAAAATAIVAVHSWFFFRPPSGLARASSYKAVAAVDRMTDGALDAISALRGSGPVTIVDYGSAVAFRQLEYYFPDDYVVVLPDRKVFFRHRPLPKPSDAAGILRPGSRRIVCLLPYNSNGSQLPGWRKQGPVYYTDLNDPAQVAIGPYLVIRQTS
jgi:4-amino-4-deoxy-L-arabinose transferase-like glycosyltransferase